MGEILQRQLIWSVCRMNTFVVIVRNFGGCPDISIFNTKSEVEEIR